MAEDPRDAFADCWMCQDDEMAFGYAPDGSGEHCPVCDNIVHEYGPADDEQWRSEVGGTREKQPK